MCNKDIGKFIIKLSPSNEGNYFNFNLEIFSDFSQNENLIAKIFSRIEKMVQETPF